MFRFPEAAALLLLGCRALERHGANTRHQFVTKIRLFYGVFTEM